MKEMMKRMKELVKVLEPAARSYYKSGIELMTNFEYDRLYDELEELEKKTGIILAGSPTQRVGYEVADSLPKKKHNTPMLSLAKTKQVEELIEKAGDKVCYLSWKMDGLTIVLTYDDGKLVEAVTRGNGEIGEVITQNAKYMKGVPLAIPDKGHKVIRGEATISYSMLKKVNDSITDGREPYKNPRNLCAGTIRNYDPQVVAEREVTFFSFDYVEGSPTNSHKEGLDSLADMGFGVVEGRVVTKDNIAEAVEWFSEKIKTNDFPSDGLVLVYDDIEYGLSLGATSKFPRKGIAYKWQDEVAETTIREIEWSVSRTGRINPVAIFDTVDLEGTDVSRASIHNVTQMKNMKVGIGDKVTVYKANMIIPQIADNLTQKGPAEIPSVCPVCGAPTEIRVDENSGCEVLYCTGKNCLDIMTTKIDHYCSRDAMNIVGISTSTIKTFFEAGILHNILDIYSLKNHRDAIVQMDSFGDKKFNKLIKAIESSSEVEIYRFLYALGIPEFGVSNCKTVCRSVPFESIYDFSVVTKEDLTTIPGVGEAMANSFIEFFKNEENAKMVEELSKHVSFIAEEVKEGPAKLDGMTFVITGTLEKCSRKELQAKIEAEGGTVAGSVSAKTKALINNDSKSLSSKNKKAKELGIPILTEDEFYNKYL